jgi:hypothetical protein
VEFFYETEYPGSSPPPFLNYQFQKKSGYKGCTNGSNVYEPNVNYEQDPKERITVENK